MNREEKIVFAASPGDGVPLVILGVPAAAWEYMKGGLTHTFDLTKIGLPIKIVVFGGKDHAEIMATLDRTMKQSGSAYFDERNKDFGIAPKKGGTP